MGQFAREGRMVQTYREMDVMRENREVYERVVVMAWRAAAVPDGLLSSRAAVLSPCPCGA